jgi:hypothetical protein
VATVTRFDPETLEVYTDLAFNGDDSGEVVKFYDGYLAELLPTIGLPAGHVWENQKPEYIGSTQQIEPSGGVAVFDIQKQLQRNVSAKNDLFQVSFPNDLNAFTGFRVAYRESYIDLLGEVEESTEISAYDELSGFVSLTVASVSGFNSGGYAILQGFSEGKYNGAVVKVRQVVNSTTLQIEVSYDAYLSLTASETIQPYSLDLARFSSSYTNEGNQYWAVNSALELGSFYGTNLVDYVASSPSELAEFMTVFAERNVFADQFEDFTVIVDTQLLESIVGDVVMAYRQEQYDKGGNLVATDIEVITSQGEGVYRLPTGGNPTDAVTNLVAEGGIDSINLSWDALETIPLFAKYEIWRSLSPGVLSTGSLLATSSTNSYTDTATNSGVTYYYIVRAVGAYASKFSNEANAEELIVFAFQTNWDTTTDGAFNPTLTGGSTTWIFGTDEAIGTNPNYSGSYLDGTTKTVIVSNTDFSAVTDINFNSDKIVGDLDLSIITGGNKSFLLSENTGITSVRTGVCNLTDFQTNCNATSALAALHLSDSTCTGDLILTNLANNLATLELPTGTCTLLQVPRSKLTALNTTGLLLSGAISIGTTTFLTSITFDPAPQTVGTITARDITNVPSFNASQLTVNGQLQVDTGFSAVTIGGGNLTRLLSVFGNLNIISLGSATISSATTSVSLNNNGMTIAEVDAVWVELDRVAVATGTARTLNVSGQGVPSATSLTARNSLISKGYTLVI